MTQDTKTSDPQDRHVLIVGGAGYVGSVMVRALLQQGYRVRALDRLLYRNSLSIESLYDEENFSFVFGDLGDPETIKQASDGITDVVLLASLVGDPISKKYPDLTRSVNLDSSKRLFDQMNRQGIDRFIFTSTCSNYGLLPDGQVANEETALNPLSIYAETKVAMEKFILDAKDSVSFSPTILRIATAYGLSPRMRFDLTVNEFVYMLANKQPLQVYDKDTWRPYCHIRDIADAVMTVMNAPRETVFGEVFNVGNDENNYTKAMLVDEILKIIPGDVSFVEGSTDPRNYRVSFEKIRSRLNFLPGRSVKAYIPQLVAAVQSNMFIREQEIPGYYGNYEIKED